MNSDKQEKAFSEYKIKSNPIRTKNHNSKRKNNKDTIDDYFDKTFNCMKYNEIKYLSIGENTPKGARGSHDSRFAVRHTENSHVFEHIHEILKKNNPVISSIAIVDKRNLIPTNGIKNCYSCGKKFSFFTRKHHCKICGKIFCSNCCKSRRSGSFGKNKMCEKCEINANRYKQTLEEFKIIEATHNCFGSNLGEAFDSKQSDFRENSENCPHVDLRAVEMKKISSGLDDKEFLNDYINTTESKSFYPNEDTQENGILKITVLDGIREHHQLLGSAMKSSQKIKTKKNISFDITEDIQYKERNKTYMNTKKHK